MRGNVLVPVGPIREVVLEWIAQSEINQLALSEKLGVSERIFHRLNEQKNITFTVADLLITKTVGPLQWMEDPRLHEIYMAANLKKLDIVVPLENKKAQAHARKSLIQAHEEYDGNKTHAARSLGMDVQLFTRRLDQALIEEGREPATQRVPQRGRPKKAKPRGRPFTAEGVAT